MIRVGRYQVHLDALLARVVYRWRGRIVLLVLGVCGVLAGVTGVLPPFWRGRAVLNVTASPGATVSVDERPWSAAVYAGTHRVVATLPDGRRAWADLTLRAGERVTLTLPAGLAPPRLRTLPAAAPGTHIAHVWWADDAWRVLSQPDVVPPDPDQRPTAGPTPTPAPGQTVAVGMQRAVRLATIDAYAGYADQVQRAGQTLEAWYRPIDTLGTHAGGIVEVHGWGTLVQTMMISAPLSLLRFAPSGEALLIAEQVLGGGTQVSLWTPDQVRTPLVAVPGAVVRLTWHADGRAVVLHSRVADRLALTLVRLDGPVLAAVVAEVDARLAPDGLVPLAWDDAGLVWVAPDAQGRATRWHAPLTTLIPEAQGALDACALMVLPDGALRVVRVVQGQVTIGRVQAGVFVGEALVPVPPSVELTGVWQGDALLLRSATAVWLLDVPGASDGR